MPPLCRLQIDFVMVAPPNRDDSDDDTLLDDLIDQAIAHVSQFDFVSIAKIAAKLCCSHMR